MISSDYEDLFNTLNTHRIKYLVVGAHAVMFYSEPRFTKDLDVWIPAALNDPRRVHVALKVYGVPLKGIAVRDFQDPTMILQIGVAPVRVDILVGLPGVSVKKAWEHRRQSRYGRTRINVLGLRQLIQAKQAAGRPQDMLDLAKLRRRQDE